MAKWYQVPGNPTMFNADEVKKITFFGTVVTLYFGEGVPNIVITYADPAAAGNAMEDLQGDFGATKFPGTDEGSATLK
jgi:hypothetical protein